MMPEEIDTAIHRIMQHTLPTDPEQWKRHVETKKRIVKEFKKLYDRLERVKKYADHHADCRAYYSCLCTCGLDELLKEEE